MERKQFIAAHANITDFLIDHNIKYSKEDINIEKEWTDFKFKIEDLKQIERINTWLQEDLQHAIKGWSDIQIDAPNPMAGKENQLRVRVYKQRTADES